MMSSNPKNLKISLRKSHRRIRRRSTLFSRRRRAHAAVRACKAHQRRRSIGKGAASSSKVSDKLEALKNLINPDNRGGELVKADQLFQDTADYIVLLRTQVFVLQRLIEFYGSSTPTAAAAAATTTTK